MASLCTSTSEDEFHKYTLLNRKNRKWLVWWYKELLLSETQMCIYIRYFRKDAEYNLHHYLRMLNTYNFNPCVVYPSPILHFTEQIT